MFVSERIQWCILSGVNQPVRAEYVRGQSGLLSAAHACRWHAHFQMQLYRRLYWGVLRVAHRSVQELAVSQQRHLSEHAWLFQVKQIKKQYKKN